MEEGAHLGHLNYRPAPQLWTGDKCPPPPCFRVLFGKVQKSCISRDQTTGAFKSHHLQAGVSHLCPPPPFLSAVHEKSVVFFKGTHGLFGGARAPQAPPWVRHWILPGFLLHLNVSLRKTLRVDSAISVNSF